jgi:hypothetical protein
MSCVLLGFTAALILLVVVSTFCSRSSTETHLKPDLAPDHAQVLGWHCVIRLAP